MLKQIRFSLESFPLKVIFWKILCKIFRTKIPRLLEWQNSFKSKYGIEIGGPTDRMFAPAAIFPCIQ